MKQLTILVISFFLFKNIVLAQDTYTTAGTYSWTCPAGVTSITVQCWGGGGAGGAGTSAAIGAGSGGAGGAYVSSSVAVTAGTAYTITVGAGGTGGTGVGGAGNGSWFKTSGTIFAEGGAGGTADMGAKGTGSSAASIGTLKQKGGDGATGVSGTNSGGGGGGAGTTGSGGTTSTGAAGAGTAIGGGNGGAGNVANLTGASGNNAGGGGSGGYRSSGVTKNGGSGGTGRVDITWVCTSYALTGTSVAAPVCAGSTPTATLTGLAASLPVGSYTVKYNLSAPNLAAGLTATMTVTTAGTGTFVLGTLANAGSTTLTITNLYSGTSTNTANLCSSTISLNNTATMNVLSVPTAVIVSGAGTFCYSTTITASGGTGGTMYFQGTTSGGTSTATPLVSKVVSATGTYYFNSFNGSCWGTQGSAAVTINGYAPGTYSVGPTGNFSSITNALASITLCPLTGAYILELQSTYASAGETFPLTVGLYSGISATNTITIRPATGATNLSITSANTTGTINMNGANYITFDGRPGGAGVVKQLSIINTSTSGYAVQLINDASHNALKYCTVQGVNTTATEGVIFFSTTTGTTGNDNNTIDNCDIGAGASTPNNLIYSSGTIATTAKFNSGEIISNCSIHDFFNAGADHNGIWISDGSTDWTITGNSFYETAPRSITTLNVVWCAIRIQNFTPSGTLRSTNVSSCNNTVISGNFIGGTTVSAGSTPLTITNKGAIRCIMLYGGSGAANSIQGNTIANIAFSTSAVSVCAMIYHADGSANIGTTSPNIIGSTTGTGSIVFTSNVGLTANSTFAPIFLGGAIITIAGVPHPETIVPGTVNFQNNTIGAITVNATDSCQLRVIDFEQSLCTFNITNNTIGNSTADNILNTTKQGSMAIIGFSGTSGVTQNISNNVIQNFRINNASTKNQLLAIQTAGDLNVSPTGLYNVSGNTIHDFVSNSKMSTANGTVVLGIDARGSTPGEIISGNSIYNFTATDATVTARVRGILYTPGPTSGTNAIAKNIVYGLKTASPTGIIRGIDVESGPFSVENNMVVLGYDATGASLTNNLEIEGIYNTTSANTFYYNSVHVTGSGVVSGASNSYAYFDNNTSPKTIKNNLFINSRSNAAGSAKNYGITITNATGLTSDYNDIYTSGTGGIFGNNGSDQATLVAWQGATGADLNSINAAASFANAASDLHLTASPSVLNFLINNQGTPIAGITTDIDGNTRSAYTPDPGYDEFKGTGSWIGTSSSAWTTSSNWDDNIVPNSSLDVKVSNAPNMPSVITNPESVNSIYITAPGTVTVNGGTLQIAGSIYNNGTFNTSAGTIEMIGTSTQTIPANAFQNNALANLVISNTSVGGLVLGGALDIYQSMAFSSSGMSFSTNDFLTMKSTSTNTAWVGDVTGNTITGQATVERYISARKAWRFLSIPTNTGQTIKNTWQEGAVGTGSNPVPGYGIQITGSAGTGAGFDLYSAAPSMKTFVPATNTWTGVPNTTTAGIAATEGYMTFIRGDRAANLVSSTPSQTVLRTKGNLYIGNQTPIVVAAGKFASIGNPYASTLDMRNITKTGIKDFFYVWDPQLGGGSGFGAYQTFYNTGSNYAVIPGGGSYGASGSTNNFIESGQAFFVQGDVAGGTLTFKEAAKTSGSTMVSFAEGLPSPQIRVNLSGISTTGTPYMLDGLIVNFDDSYSNDVDDLDAVKSINASENLAVKTSNTLLVVERRHSITANDTIFLNLSGVKAQKYRFEINAAQMVQPGLTAFLEDSYLNTSMPIDLSGNTVIDFTVINNPGSYAVNRFRIVFTPPSTLPLTFTSIKAYPKNNNNEVEWSTSNESNLVKYDVEKSNDATHYSTVNTVAANNGAVNNYNYIDVKPSAGNNYYRVKSTDVNGKISYSKVVKVFTGDAAPAISIYPNPVTNGTIHLQFANEPAGTYRMKLLNQSGQALMNTEVTASGSGSESIPVNKSISNGIYQAEISRPDGTKTNIKISIVK
jgi:hypothetical protein